MAVKEHWYCSKVSLADSVYTTNKIDIFLRYDIVGRVLLRWTDKFKRIFHSKDLAGLFREDWNPRANFTDNQERRKDQKVKRT